MLFPRPVCCAVGAVLLLLASCGGGGGGGEPALLSRTSDEPIGEECPQGGTRIDIGFDDGGDREDEESIRDNGILEDGEVQSSTVICNENFLSTVRDISPPDGPPGTSTIDLSGGDSFLESGGPGGVIDFPFDGDTVVRDLKIFNTGEVDASFTLPSIDVELGEEPLVVSGTLTVLTPVAATEVGDVYSEGDRLRVRGAGPDPDPIVTGVRVEEGATLRMLGGTGAFLDNDFELLGTLTTVDGGEMGLAPDRFVSSTAATINAARGQLDVVARGTLINQAAINTAGSTDSVDGGSVVLTSRGGTYNTGDIDTRGFDDASGVGGQGGPVIMRGFLRGVHNSGAITTSGGDGRNGGSGGQVALAVEFDGPIVRIVNSGAIDTSGGAGTDVNGGSAGTIEMISRQAPVIQGGSVRARGGDAPQGFAGEGGVLVIRVQGPTFVFPVPGAFDVLWSGELDLRGGQGGLGGPGGRVVLFHSGRRGSGRGSEVQFLGYSSVNLDGGDSTGSSGGPGGGIFVNEQFQPAELDIPPGLYMHVPVSATGGEGTVGGPGGTVTHQALEVGTLSIPDPQPGLVCAPGADLSLSGGRGTEQAGRPGLFEVSTLRSISVQCDVDVPSGSLQAGGGGALDGGRVQLHSLSGDVLVSGDLTVDAGDAGTAPGSPGGFADIFGTSVMISGGISARGGSSTIAGGPGGFIRLNGFVEPTVVSGTLNVAGGSGSPPGPDGMVLIDAF